MASQFAMPARFRRHIRLLLWLLVTAAVIAGCTSAPTAPAPVIPSNPTVTAVATASLSPTLPAATATIPPTATADATSTVVPPQASAMPADLPTTPTPKPTWIPVSGETVEVPILTYHHVSDGHPNNRYYVSVSDFRDQMEALRRLGRTAITLADLVRALHGGALPENPVVITFDDGDLDVYQNAFPIMRDLGFPGVFFIISTTLHSEGFVDASQLQEMIAAGWEIGSHSRTHANLTKYGVDGMKEMAQSRKELEQTLGVPVISFAYPFNAENQSILAGARLAGYEDGACSGWSNHQSLVNIYCLSRREIKGSTTLDKFIEMIQAP